MDARDFIRSNTRLPPKLANSVTMTVPAPHFLLFSEARSAGEKAAPSSPDSGLWHFVLESVDGTSTLEATDEEAEVDPERLELLAVVRGLEALDQPSNVTLVTRSRSVTRGLRFGIDHWRENGWQWECFGRMSPIKDSDLWQRVDRALRFHKVRCRVWRFDPPAETARGPRFSSRRRRDGDTGSAPGGARSTGLARRFSACLSRIAPSLRRSLSRVE